MHDDDRWAQHLLEYRTCIEQRVLGTVIFFCDLAYGNSLSYNLYDCGRRSNSIAAGATTSKCKLLEIEKKKRRSNISRSIYVCDDDYYDIARTLKSKRG